MTATAEVLFGHVDPTPPARIPSQFPSDAASQAAVAWDDFTVPPGEVWHPLRVFVDGAASGPATSTEVDVLFNAGTPDSSNGIDVLTLPPSSGSGATYPDLDLDVDESSHFPPGNYWLSVRALPLGPSSNRWFWQANDDRFGEQPRSTMCFPASSAPDQSFRIEGVRTPAEIKAGDVKPSRTGG